MNNTFKQPQKIWRLSLITQYRYLPLFENEFEESALAIASNEVSSETIESMENDTWQIDIYLSKKPSVDILPQNLLTLVKHNSIKIELLENKDWTIDAALALSDIKTDIFHIIRSEDAVAIDDTKLPLLINITQAFGTGEHETTLGCIEALELEKNKKVKNVIDIGTGTGILAIAAKKIWPEAQVMATDIDKVAVEVASEHAKLNNTDINIHLADGAGNNRTIQKFDIVIANILARPLIEMAKDITEIATNSGTIILSGFLENQLHDIIDKYQKYGFCAENIINKNKWIVLVLKKNPE